MIKNCKRQMCHLPVQAKWYNLWVCLRVVWPAVDHWHLLLLLLLFLLARLKGQVCNGCGCQSVICPLSIL